MEAIDNDNDNPYSIRGCIILDTIQLIQIKSTVLERNKKALHLRKKFHQNLKPSKNNY